jgi:hypothetical protein
MRKLNLLACSVAVTAAVASSAGAAEPNAGQLSVENGKGVVRLDLRGSVLGRLASGRLRVTDHTPNDRFAPLVFGSKVIPERVGPRTVVYRGQGLRFRMVGGGYLIVVRGTGIAISAVGRGVVTLDGDRLVAQEDAGIYSFDGTDCLVEPERCTPLPDDPERFQLGPVPEKGESGRAAG